jgi:hypothetical protein
MKISMLISFITIAALGSTKVASPPALLALYLSHKYSSKAPQLSRNKLSYCVHKKETSFL